MAGDGTPPILQGTEPGLYSVLSGGAARHSVASESDAGSVLEPSSGTPPSMAAGSGQGSGPEPSPNASAMRSSSELHEQQQETAQSSNVSIQQPPGVSVQECTLKQPITLEDHLALMQDVRDMRREIQRLQEEACAREAQHVRMLMSERTTKEEEKEAKSAARKQSWDADSESSSDEAQQRMAEKEQKRQAYYGERWRDISNGAREAQHHFGRFSDNWRSDDYRNDDGYGRREGDRGRRFNDRDRGHFRTNDDSAGYERFERRSALRSELKPPTTEEVRANKTTLERHEVHGWFSRTEQLFNAKTRA